MALAAALAASLVGCANPDPPAPRPLRVNPDRGAASQAVAVVISGADFAASTSTDFEGRDPSTLDARFQASLDATPLRDVRIHADGTLTATVPDGIPIGLHDLVVVSPEGREGRLAAAYRALADAEVAQLVASYRIEPPGPQQAWAPFAVTITALDPAGSPVGGYSGAVTLSDLTGTAVPGAPALFRNGVWSGTVEIRAAHSADVLTVEDALGNRGASAPFSVAPTPAAALRITTPPRSTVAGACSGAAQPLIVEVTDAFGLPTVAAGALALAPAAVPGLELFGDDACTMPLAAPVITAGSGSLTVWYRSTRAGTATVELSAAALTPASQLQTVVAGPPARVTFVSAPQLVPAGSCSLAATVEVRDAWENPALGGAVAVALASAPASGFELFSDAACATPASGVTSAGATARADFWFRGTTAQAVTVTASGASLAADAQVETVTSQAAASRLAFLTPPRTAAAGTCSGDVTVQAQDAFGNPVTGAASVAVSLGAVPAAGLAFYADAGCSSPIASASIPAGQSAVTVHFRGTVATAETLSATAAGVTGASQGATVVPAAPHHLAFTSAPQSLMAGACSAAAAVQLRDAFENVPTAAAATLVALAATPTSGFAFYSDATCSAQVPSATIAAGGSDAAFHFRATVTGSFAVDASAAGLVGASQVEAISPALVDRVVFITDPQTVAAGACSGVATVQTMDPLGNVAPVTTATPVNLAAAPSAGFGFYSDSGCTSAVSSVTLAANGSQQSFWFRGDVVGTGSVTVTASAAGLASATQSETLVPAAPSQLAFTTAPQSVTAGACSGVATVQARDPLGNGSPVSAATTVNLAAAPSTGFGFYSDSGCTSLVSSITLAAGGSQQSFWFRGDVVGTGSVTVTASAAGLASATQTETLVPAAPSQLAFTTAPQSVTAGACSGAATVQARDPLDNPSPVAAATPVDLSASPATGFTFYSNATCTSAVTSITLPPNGSQASFWFRGDVVGTGSVSVTASATGLGSTSQTETLNPGVASKLVFTTGAQTLTAGACSGIATIQQRDSLDNPVAADASVALTLTALPAAGTTFYADAACAIPVGAGEPAIISGSSTASFHFKGTVAGTLRLTVSATGRTSAVQDETIEAGSPAKLVFASAPQAIAAGTCSAAATLGLRDASDNVAVAAGALDVGLAATPGTGFTFYADAACAIPASGVTVADGASTAELWFEGTDDGAVTVEATATGLAGATQVETIQPAAADHLDFLSAAQAVVAGACSGEVVVQSKDALENVSPVSASKTIALSASPGAGFTFYADAGCSSAVSSVTLAAGASQGSFWFRGSTAGNVDITASVSGWTSPPTQPETIQPAAATQLVFSSPAQTVTAGACSAEVVLQSKDALGNVSPVTTAKTISLGASPAAGFAFYTDSGCSNGVSSVGLAAGTSQASFWFRGDAAGTVTVTASVSGWTAPTQDEVVVAGAATHFAWDAVSTPQTADRAFTVRITALDAFGNRDTTFALAATLSLTLSPPLSPVPTLTCTSGCTGLSATFSAGVWTGQVSVSEPASPDSAAPDHWLVATAGTVTGTSAGFAVTGIPTHSPPTAVLTATPAAAKTNQSVTFDASGSSDYQTPAAGLVFSFDLSGTSTAAPGTAPWTPWSSSATVANSFTTAGTKTVRVAVKDADGDIGYAAVTLLVVSGTGSTFCEVKTSAWVDSGTGTCADADVSLPKALRLAQQDGVITFSGPMTITSSGTTTISKRVTIAGFGVVIQGRSFVLNEGDDTRPIRFIGVELTGQTTPISVESGHFAIFEDVYFHDSAGLATQGSLQLDRVRMTGCASACVRIDDTDSGGEYLKVRASDFRGSGSGYAINAVAASSSDPLMNVQSSLFTGFATAIRIATPGYATIVNNTFEANGTGIQFLSGTTGHSLRNNIFSNQTVAAATWGTATFTNRDYHLLWQNADDGLLAGDPNVLATDPLYLYPAGGDFRLSLGSPAIDSGIDTGINLLPAFPTSTPRYLGIAPDRGGYETW